MFVRFVIPARDDDSGRRQGLFQKAYALRRSNELSAHLQEQLDGALTWLDEHLKAPDRFTRGKRKNEPGLAIGWFKASAHDHIAHMRTVCRVLNECDIATEMLTTDRPGYIVFEDAYQVAAAPFSDTIT
ncbi:MAG TPA: hypothetical protein VF175_05180 [Lacipirellula sp.]